MRLSSYHPLIQKKISRKPSEQSKKALIICDPMPRNNKKWMYFLVVGSNFGFSVAAGLLLGRYIDSRMGNEMPYFTILGLIAGVISGITVLIKLLNMKNGEK